MMKPRVLLFAMLLCNGIAMGQVPTKGPSSEALQSCLLGTDDDTWAALKLTTDQLYRIKDVQEACKTECTAAGTKKVVNPISNADGSTVMDEVVSILTPEQYRAWMAYCAASTVGGPAAK